MTVPLPQSAARLSVAAPLVTFVIPVRNDAARLRRCLESIAANDAPGEIEIVIADNGSTDASRQVGLAAGARVLDLPGRPVAELRNAAGQAARGEILAFVDADHVLDSGWLAFAVQGLSDPSVGAIGAPYLSPAGGSWVQRAYGCLRAPARGQRDTEWLAAGNIAMRRDEFVRVGGFDTALETCEDFDLCARLRADGRRVVSDERLRSTHLGDPSTLRGLLLGELWRGRDNIRATLRGPLSFHSLLSMLVPVADLGFLSMAGVGLVAWSSGGAPWALSGASGTLLLGGLRCARMMHNAETRRVRDLPAMFVVALVYNVARALALVVRASHQTRRERAGQ